MLAKVVQCLPGSNAARAASRCAGSGSQPPEISHAIPSCVLQLLKSERWNFAVFEVVVCVAVGELHAELMGARPVNSTVRAAMLPRAACRWAYAAVCPAWRARLVLCLLRRECRALVLRRLLSRLRRLAGCLLGAGVSLDIFGGEGVLR